MDIIKRYNWYIYNLSNMIESEYIDREVLFEILKVLDKVIITENTDILLIDSIYEYTN